MHRYRIAGLKVRSDIEMPGLHADPTAGEPDIGICSDTTPVSLPGATAKGPTWSMSDDQLLIRVPGIARYLLSEGRTIIYQPEPQAEPQDVAAFLTGTVFGILMQQRGLAVLHASSVKVGDCAVLFMGASGAGKSTLAAALVQRGYPLVTDDVCVIDFGGAGAPRVLPDARWPKLWINAIERLELAGHPAKAVRGQLAKFHVDLGLPDSGPEALPCGPVYALREAIGPLRAGIERPNVVDAALLLRLGAYRGRLVKQMRQNELYLRLAAAIGNRGGVFHLTRELDFGRMPAVVDELERHWAQVARLASVQ
ncbi:MAG TPA: hypothetical protein VFE13_05695 [Caulobacteraceae bacterium]|nr:hypothetical protein [Caulobacteraceae bacterium]